MNFRSVITKFREQLDTLRVQVKYLAFDLECTRRERDEARRDAEFWYNVVRRTDGKAR